MCGIVGLFTKNIALEQQLGSLLAQMLLEMTERGPDSTGVAIYARGAPQHKLTVLADDPQFDWSQLRAALATDFETEVGLFELSNHAVLNVVAASMDALSAWLQDRFPELRINSAGEAIEIYKGKGLAHEVVERFEIPARQGTHGLGHTRMATESAVTTEHAHPFSSGVDLCLVHNGSLSNHNRLRRVLQAQGIQFQTDNDSEVAAGYLAWRMGQGASLDEALQAALVDLDGFYTFAVGSRDGFAVLRDPVGCKPAMVAETDDWVAMASEFRAIAQLPGVEAANIWEPTPGKIYFWTRH